MSIQHDVGKAQEAPSRASPLLQDKQVFPTPHFPQPPQQPPRPNRNLWVVIGAIVMTLALLTSLGIFFTPALFQRPGGQATATPTTSTQITPTTVPTAATTPTVSPPSPTPVVTPSPTPVVTPSPTLGVVLGPQACPPSVSNPAYWNAIIGTMAGKRHAEGISCANILGTSSLQALVLVRYTDVDATLDAYGFNNISTTPTRIFALQGLAGGDARISGYNTIMTAEVDQDPTSSDLYREFQWSTSKGGLVQVAFPGIFPDLTRYQAEADQAWVNAGKDSWKKDAKQVALRLVSTFIGWKVPATAIVMSGGGSSDVSATIRVRAELPGTPTAQKPYFTIRLDRLEGNSHNIWVAIALNQGSALFNTIQPRSLVASPVKLEGTGNPFEGDIGEAYILDHSYTRVGHAHLTVPSGWGARNGPYSVLVGYELSFTKGPQEGIVEVEQTNPSGMGSFAVVMVKVLLNPQPRIVQGPVFCPVAALAGLGLNSLTANCGNLKGDSSLQALVSGNGKIAVYDYITTAHPVQIWSMQTQNAKISGANTIITDDIVANSHIYREFQWSSKAGTFVQVVFSGMYPDMTRWQAEEDQRQVLVGEKSRISAVNTATNLIGGVGKLVKGGGSRDLTAVVNVTYPSPGGGSPSRVTQVTLSRLEGNITGIWEVAAVGSNWLSISAPRNATTIISPVMVKGSGPQYEAQIGVVYILDQRYEKIQVGDTYAMAPDGSSPPSPFSLEVKYTSGFQGGTQEGIIELVHTGGASFDYGVVMVKVLISA